MLLNPLCEPKQGCEHMLGRHGIAVQQYPKWKKFNESAQIAWIKVGFLRHLVTRGGILPRMQDVPGDARVIGVTREEDAFFTHQGDPFRPTDARYGPRIKRYVVSHPWLFREHPDAEGTLLKQLVEYLQRIQAGDDDLVFFDFCSLPQKPRNSQEGEQFSDALRGMQLLFAFAGADILIMPSIPKVPIGPSQPGITRNPTPYIKRGWCFFELCVSGAHEPCRVHLIDAEKFPKHADIAVQSYLCKRIPPITFQREFASKEFTNKDDTDKVLDMYWELWSEHEMHSGKFEKACCPMPARDQSWFCNRTCINSLPAVGPAAGQNRCPHMLWTACQGIFRNVLIGMSSAFGPPWTAIKHTI